MPRGYGWGDPAGASRRTMIHAVSRLRGAPTKKETRLRGLEVGVGEDEPFAAGVVEVDLHAGVGAGAFHVGDDAGAEFGVGHVLADGEAGRAVVDDGVA